MRVLLEGRVFERPATGVAKATMGLYAACLARLPALRVAVLHRRPLRAALPAGLAPRRVGRLLPEGLWGRQAVALCARWAPPAFVHFPWNGGVPRLPAGTRVVTTLHDVLPLAIPQHFRDAAGRQAYCARVQRDLDRTDLLITDSEYSRGEILRHFRVRSEPVVIPLASTLPPGPPAAGPARGSYFLYVGGYTARKNLEGLVRLFCALRREGALRSRLVLTGSRHYFSREFARLVAEGVSQGVVEEAGYVPDEALAGLLAGARALVYPSRYEGFGLPPLEAMAAGCPVVTTAGTSLPEVCGEAALYVDPGDERAFAQALCALERDEGLRRELRARGRARAARFSWDAAAARFLGAVLSRLADDGKERAHAGGVRA